MECCLDNQQTVIDDDLECEFYPDFFFTENTPLYTQLVDELNWQQERLLMYGKLVSSPRLTVMYGDDGVAYNYSGITQNAAPWTPLLVEIKHQLEQVCDCEFNSVLANYYRDGNDSMGWHSDDEPALGKEPVVASISLGASRDFYLRNKKAHQQQHQFTLPGGSLFVMQGGTQQYWQHSLPKRKRCYDGRVNLSFRKIIQ